MPALAHLGIGLATKRFAPQIPLWALLISSMILDILSFIFISALWITHGLFMSVIWSVAAFLLTFLITKMINSKKEQQNKEFLQFNIIIAFVVFSHWVLDFIGWPMSVIDSNATGVPVLFDDAVNIGLGIYTTWFGALSMDIGVFVAGLGLYLLYRRKHQKEKTSIIV